MGGWKVLPNNLQEGSPGGGGATRGHSLSKRETYIQRPDPHSAFPQETVPLLSLNNGPGPHITSKGIF